MKCRNPFGGQGRYFPCGKCEPCLLSKRRLWTHRILMEAACHAQNAFLTLTYSDEFIPGNGSLSPTHLRNFLKRLRKSVRPLRIRFYAVGEYGDVSWRPHYHLAVFGFAGCAQGRTFYSNGHPACCARCAAVHTAWGFGRIDLGTLNIASAQYVCGYVTKKMTRFDDERLGNRHPEFARMSLRPGIGALRLPDIVRVLSTFNLADTQGDVPSSLRVGTRLMPLGRYLRGQLRQALGILPPSQRKGHIDAQLQELLVLRYDEAFLASGLSYKDALVSADNQKVLNEKSRRQNFNKRKPL